MEPVRSYNCQSPNICVDESCMMLPLKAHPVPALSTLTSTRTNNINHSAESGVGLIGFTYTERA